MITRDLKKMEERKNKRIGVGRVVSSLCWSVYAMSIRSVRRTGTGTFTHPHPHQPSSPSDPHPHPHRHCHPHKVSTSPIQRENPNEKQTSKGRKEVAPPPSLGVAMPRDRIVAWWNLLWPARGCRVDDAPAVRVLYDIAFTLFRCARKPEDLPALAQRLALLG